MNNVDPTLSRSLSMAICKWNYKIFWFFFTGARCRHCLMMLLLEQIRPTMFFIHTRSHHRDLVEALALIPVHIWWVFQQRITKFMHLSADGDMGRSVCEWISPDRERVDHKVMIPFLCIFSRHGVVHRRRQRHRTSFPIVLNAAKVIILMKALPPRSMPLFTRR